MKHDPPKLKKKGVGMNPIDDNKCNHNNFDDYFEKCEDCGLSIDDFPEELQKEYRQQFEEEVTMTQEHKDYLEDLRASGVVNMWGAGDFLAKRFDLSEKDASKILVEWIKFKKAGK